MSRAAHSLTPAHPAIRAYLKALGEYRSLGVEHELGLRSAFQNLLDATARLQGWALFVEESARSGGRNIRFDGTLRDRNSLPRGYWEAKDSRDDLDREIERKIRSGYFTTNTIFEDTRHAVLFQDRNRVLEADLSDPRQISDLLARFLSYTEPDIQGFEEAIGEFEERVPDLVRGLALKVEEAHRDNHRFQEAFAGFFSLCQLSLNPNLRREAVDEMLVQHLLTERLIRTIFNNPGFTRRNVVAREVEDVIDALVSESFSREEYLKGLDRFYCAIEAAARIVPDFSDKQRFLNHVYERFFRGYSVKVADTHGIVYTPPEIVEFMCASVEEALQQEFGLSLSSPGVNIIDPCTGTGNFIVHLMRRIAKRDLPRVYREQLFANEVMLLPYYIAALNIEHEYLELSGKYEPFEGLCFVDTLDMAEDRQMPLFTERNAGRVKRQKETPITVVIGNPPYNVGQLNENDNNKNRKYPVIDRRIAETYARDSKATSVSKLNDPYVKFFRWATDRLEKRDGIVCFVSNSGFVHGIASDGFREHLERDFQRIYHFDFKGNARTTGERRRQEGGNVFGDMIRVGVGITLAVRWTGLKRAVYYHCVDDYWSAEEKTAQLASFKARSEVPWKKLKPDADHTWLVPEHADEYTSLVPVAEVFDLYSLGISTNRDDVAYDFRRGTLTERIQAFIDDYNAEVDRYRRAGRPEDVDSFVRYERVKWSEGLKLNLKRGNYAEFRPANVRVSLYRAYTKRFLFFDAILNERRYKMPRILPHDQCKNRILCCTNHTQMPFVAQMTDCLPSQAPGGRAGQCFPFYTYAPDGTNRKENITDEALARFRDACGDQRITKWDIFHYIYAILHHPGYRERFAENLRRELPRIPFAPDFHAFAKTGEELARLHVEYESLEPWPLEFVCERDEPLSYEVRDKMRLSKDKTSLQVNSSLTLAGIPPEVYEYRLGNRSALEWVVDQYQVSEDARSGIRSDPNRKDDPEYIVRLVGQVVRVSMETVRLVRSLPEEYSR